MYIMPLNVRALNWRMTHMEEGKKKLHTHLVDLRSILNLLHYCVNTVNRDSLFSNRQGGKRHRTGTFLPQKNALGCG